MISRIKDFEFLWIQEFDKTQKVFKHIPDKALPQAVDPSGRTLGRLAWHIATTIPEMMGQTGLSVAGPAHTEPVPATMLEIRQAYERAGLSVLEAVKSQWTDATLEVTDAMYGQTWKRGYTLTALIFHQIHHRAQMTVLMRQAGLPVPGLYGPAREEWAQWGLPVPAV
ncbi:MAG: DinB family protein [Acidobacteria bacterium]|nr:DinB family protein [Acidobacteriota bacterium]MCI0724623.1 DinB family protein [Acidobacteriota bacterium]